MMNFSSIVSAFAGFSESLATVYSLGPMGTMPISLDPLIQPVHFINPTDRDGSFLDRDSGSELGEPLNVSVFLAMSAYHMSLKTSSRVAGKK